jgi:hypothetical protein
MPTVFRIGPYRFFFNSREELRKHIHVESPDGTVKFWLEPIVALAVYYGMSEKQLKEVEALVKERRNELIEAWNRHFGLSNN